MYTIICIHMLNMQKGACVVQYNITSFTNMISIIFAAKILINQQNSMNL